MHFEPFQKMNARFQIPQELMETELVLKPNCGQFPLTHYLPVVTLQHNQTSQVHASCGARIKYQSLVQVWGSAPGMLNISMT